MAETPRLSVVDYSSRDYAAVKTDLVNGIPVLLPEWTSRSSADFGMVMIELVSYMADLQSYYTDRVANEAFIGTAVQRGSVLSLASMLDYTPAGPGAANVTLTLTATAGADVTVPAGTQVSTKAEVGSDPVIFETDVEVVVPGGGSANVSATQGETVTEEGTSRVGTSTGYPDQSFPLYYSSVINGSISIMVDEDGAGPLAPQQWHEVTHLIDATATDRVYTTFTDENGIVYLIFGDNANGRIPAAGAYITATYRRGGGVAGNVGAGKITEPVGTIPGIVGITNVAAATGGSDAESLNSIRFNAPRGLSTLSRAVTLEDYRALAIKIPGVLHAMASATTFSNVVLYISPQGGGAPTQALKDAIANDLATKKMMGTTLTIADPVYVPIDITVNPLNVLPEYSRTTIQTDVENALAVLLDITNVDFGQRVTLSQVYNAVAAVIGVDYAVVTELHRSTGSGLADVVLESNEIPSVGTVSVTATGGLIGS